MRLCSWRSSAVISRRIWPPPGSLMWLRASAVASHSTSPASRPRSVRAITLAHATVFPSRRGCEYPQEPHHPVANDILGHANLIPAYARIGVFRSRHLEFTRSSGGPEGNGPRNAGGTPESLTQIIGFQAIRDAAGAAGIDLKSAAHPYQVGCDRRFPSLLAGRCGSSPSVSDWGCRTGTRRCWGRG